MNSTLYNLHHDGDQYRITKFIDGNPESSYLTTHSECECPAGTRTTCRHRQMLPMMLAHNLVNSHLFWDFDRNRVVDFMGLPASATDLPAIQVGITAIQMDEGPEVIHNAIANALGESPAKPWRRI